MREWVNRDQILVFTESNRFAYKISTRHLLPAITHQTKTKERKRILEAFNRGEYPAIVSSKVLNEGINVPDANIGIVLGGSGSTREHTQRLGRILRKRVGKSATLYEVIAKNTLEKGISQRRRRKRG
jgi:superfamily II DNA or RNA helicase